MGDSSTVRNSVPVAGMVMRKSNRGAASVNRCVADWSTAPESDSTRSSKSAHSPLIQLDSARGNTSRAECVSPAAKLVGMSWPSTDSAHG